MSEDELRDLESALTLLKQIDLAGIGEALDLPAGESIGDKILPWILAHKSPVRGAARPEDNDCNLYEAEPRRLGASADTLGQAIDRVDHLANALKMRLAPESHVRNLRAALPEAVQQLKDAYVRLFQQNPWEGA